MLVVKPREAWVTGMEGRNSPKELLGLSNQGLSYLRFIKPPAFPCCDVQQYIGHWFSVPRMLYSHFHRVVSLVSLNWGFTCTINRLSHRSYRSRIPGLASMWEEHRIPQWCTHCYNSFAVEWVSWRWHPLGSHASVSNNFKSLDSGPG